MPDRVYLDWNATTPLRREVRAALAAAWELSGNPSSVHAEGRQARKFVEDARAAVAAAVGALARNVVFTSGGTEANATALTPGLRRGSSAPVTRLLVSAIEHASVLAGGRFAADAIAVVGVTRAGVLDLTQLRAMLDHGPPALVSVMLANNETGAMQPVAEAAGLVHAAGGLLHVDAIQAFGKWPFELAGLDADLLTLSAHKIGGPKGVGALVVAEGVRGLEPLLRGGGQELSRRAGPRTWRGLPASVPLRVPPAWPWRPTRLAWKHGASAWRRACARRPGLSYFPTTGRGCPIPRCSRFPGSRPKPR